MGILENLGISRKKPDKILKTPYGNFNLAKKNDVKRLQRKVVELQRTTDALTRKDLEDWRRAWQMAINVEAPNRLQLYDIYTDVDIDLHLSGCMEQRRKFALARSFKIVDKNEEEDKEAVKYFNTTWFKKLVKYILDSLYWGHSLIQLGDTFIDENGRLSYDGVKLIPRKHVIPEYGRMVINVGDDWQSGVSYRELPYSEWLIEAGDPDSLGMFLKAAVQTIPKKNALAFWDTFAEIFGMPMRIAKTTVRDDKELAKMERMMAGMGTEFWGIFQEGTDIEVKESTKGDAFNVYDKRIDRANSELSKLVIGQTMTIENGSSLSQSETHLEVFQNLVESDCDMLRDIINDQLIPQMARHGFPVKGMRFDWDYSVDYTPEQQVAFETMVTDRYEVDGSYFENKYNIPVKERKRVTLPIPQKEEEEEEKEETKKQKNVRPFFD